MRSRVMPGSLVTMERRVPVNRLKRVDLPTLGRPTITSDGSRSGMDFSVLGTLGSLTRSVTIHCSAYLHLLVGKRWRTPEKRQRTAALQAGIYLQRISPG